jgi:hypothetical protein
MWARVVEVMLALWLWMSPFIFRHPPEDTFLWANDFICASLVAFLALFSFWHPLRKIHLITIGVAFWLWGIGYIDFPERTSIPLQNSVVVGLLLFMLAIIPTYAEQPPYSWREFLKKKEPKE